MKYFLYCFLFINMAANNYFALAQAPVVVTTPAPPPPKSKRFDFKIDFTKVLKDGVCDKKFEEAVLTFINSYRELYGTKGKLSIPSSSTSPSVVKDSQSWAAKLGSSSFNHNFEVMHQDDATSRVNNGKDIVLLATWNFDTRDTNSTKTPGTAVISFPNFFEEYFDRFRAIYSVFYDKNIAPSTDKTKTEVTQADLMLFDPFTRVVWASSKDIGIGCSQKYTKEKSYFFIVFNLNKEIGNAGQADGVIEPPLPKYQNMIDNVKCENCKHRNFNPNDY